MFRFFLPACTNDEFLRDAVVILPKPTNSAMADFMKKSNDLPVGFPLFIARDLAHGASENEVRQILADDYPLSKINEWVVELRSIGWFHGSSTDSKADDTNALTTAFDSLSTNLKIGGNFGTDGASCLWSELMRELTQDESDFKHRIAVLDRILEQGVKDLSEISTYEANEVFPFDEFNSAAYAWQGCGWVACAVMLFVSQADTSAKIEAVRPLSKCFGGLELPDRNDLKTIRDPFILSKTLSPACKKAEVLGVCTALLVVVMDVDIMRNPSTFMKPRPSTFAHSFVMLVSPAGVFILHGYGPRGHTLLQHMRSHSSQYPISFKDAREWTKIFEIFASDRGGVWTDEVNQGYRHCFNVDLVKLGCMRLGSQLDAFTTVNCLEFNADIIQRNFNLLPRRRSDGRKVPCCDGAVAVAKHPPVEYRPDGGVKHYYIPEILRCGHCGEIESQTGSPNKRCIRCKAIHYCCREHQVADWSNHKKICKSISSRHTKK
jgi:hypothetical protein